MLPSLTTISQDVPIIGWSGILGFLLFLWRKSIAFSVAFTKNHEASQKAMVQIDNMATNHFPHMESGIAELNKKTEDGNKTLGQIATGISVLVDRGIRA